ncbi:MAG: hypothetical protein MUC92_02405 [Fimbriimonadaceae bacterium]|nr:hypothetical protein [Fimbriimonadaceae bacterium]
MKPKISPNHPLVVHFREIVHDQVVTHVSSKDQDDVTSYLTDLLVSFLTTEGVFALRDGDGTHQTIIEMMAAADVRLGANSFLQEREVHKHIGDFILFWSGIHPETLNTVRTPDGRMIRCDYSHRAKESYHLVSTFDFPPYDREAPTFRKLSHEFEAYEFVMRQIGQKTNLYAS